MTGAAARPLVSVGFVVYNDERFVRAALESIIHQSYSNLEILICDDHSTDASGHICQEYAARDPRIQYFRHTENQGISRNMQFALSRATGEYFMWAANDDLWDPTFVVTLVDALEKRPDCLVAFCPYQFIDEEDNTVLSEPIRIIDYGSNDPLVRLQKLISLWDDGFGYGLFRRDQIRDVRLPVWRWPNQHTPRNNIYPTLFHYLSRGNFVLVGGKPLWLNRIKRRSNYSGTGTGLGGALASMALTLNVHVECMVAIARGARSPALTVETMPMLFGRMVEQLGEQVARLARRAVRARQIGVG
jgi:glycosyltransferase involved in cell wall biosynthesis